MGTGEPIIVGCFLVWGGGSFQQDYDVNKEDEGNNMTTMTMTATTSFFDATTNLVIGRIAGRGGGDFDNKDENNNDGPQL